MLQHVAVVWAFRIAIAVTPFLVRSCQTAHCMDATWVRIYQNFRERLADPAEDPAALTTEMTAAAFAEEEGAGVAVTDFSGTFELRKLQWRISRAPSGGTVEDQDVMTFHFIKATGGTPGAWVDGTDLPIVETAVSTFWTALVGDYPAFMHSDQYRWYKDGPAFWELSGDGTHYVPITPNPAIRVTEIDIAGTGSDSHYNPPQDAMTVTEKTSTRTAWGRFYLPFIRQTNTDAVGRIATAYCDTIAAGVVTMYNTCRTANVVPVVFSVAKPERPKKPSGTLPAQAAIAYEIASVQVDNLVDIIRSRRYSGATYRKVTALT